MLRNIIKSNFTNTIPVFKFDLMRLQARRRSEKMLKAYVNKGKLPDNLHFGCGGRKVEGWLNCDLKNSDVDVDLGCGKLPFHSDHFSVVCSQHVIEHLRLETELEPLFLELNRVMKDNAEIWLSCPDIEKICKAYLADKTQSLIDGRMKRYRIYSTNGYPASYFMNDIFHQDGEHKNLFDFELLAALLEKSGFHKIEKVNEDSFCARFPEFPRRDDDEQSLYVTAKNKKP